jgi:hypothetical protein
MSLIELSKFVHQLKQQLDVVLLDLRLSLGVVSVLGRKHPEILSAGGGGQARILGCYKLFRLSFEGDLCASGKRHSSAELEIVQEG